MGNAESMDAQLTDFRARNKPPKLPMPDPAELEERFAIALVKKNRIFTVSAVLYTLPTTCKSSHSHGSCFELRAPDANGSAYPLCGRVTACFDDVCCCVIAAN